jgi:hypothetical protein
MAVASHFKHITYPKAQKTIVAYSRSGRKAFFRKYIKRNHTIFSHTAICISNQQFRQGALRSGFLSVPYSLALSPQFLDKIYNATMPNTIIQLHTE